MLFSDQEGPWQLGPWKGDSRFLYFGFSSDGHHHLIFCAGSFLEFRGNRILEFRNHMQWFEWSSIGTGEFKCSDATRLLQINLPIPDLKMVD